MDTGDLTVRHFLPILILKLSMVTVFQVTLLMVIRGFRGGFQGAQYGSHLDRTEVIHL